jgi:hypothetical protein
MMGREGDIGSVGEHLDRFRDVARPVPSVPYLSTAQGEQVMEIMCGVFRHAQCPSVWEEEVHLRGRLGPGRDLEDHPDTVQDLLLAGVSDVECGRD